MAKTKNENEETNGDEPDTSSLDAIKEAKADSGPLEVKGDETTNEGHPVDEAWSEDPNVQPSKQYVESLEKGYVGEQVKDTEANG